MAIGRSIVSKNISYPARRGFIPLPNLPIAPGGVASATSWGAGAQGGPKFLGYIHDVKLAPSNVAGYICRPVLSGGYIALPFAYAKLLSIRPSTQTSVWAFANAVPVFTITFFSGALGPDAPTVGRSACINPPCPHCFADI